MIETYSAVAIAATQIDDAPTSATSAWIRCSDRTTFLIRTSAKTGSPTDLTWTIEVPVGYTLGSDDLPSGATAVAYDKILAKDGYDAPVASVVHTANTDAFISLSPEDAIPFCRIKATGNGTTGSAHFTATAYVFGKTVR